MFLDNEYNCKECPQFCQKCEDITGTCLSCNSTYVLIESNRTCQKAEKPLTVKEVDYSSLTETLTVSFNQAIITPSNLNSALKVELKDPQNSTPAHEIQYKDISLDESGSRIIFEFDFKKEDKSFEEYQIVIVEAQEGSIKAERDPRDIFKAYPIIQNDVTYIKSAIAESSVAAAKGTSYSLTFISIVLTMVSVSMAVIMIKVFQLLFFLLFINVNLPVNAASFISTFRTNILDYFPTFIHIGGNKKRSDTAGQRLRRIIQDTASNATQKSDDLFSQFCFPHKKLEENDQTCSVFINLGSFITQQVIFFALKLIVYSMKLGIRRKGKNDVTNPNEKIVIEKKNSKQNERNSSDWTRSHLQQPKRMKGRHQKNLFEKVDSNRAHKHPPDHQESDPVTHQNRPNQLIIFNQRIPQISNKKQILSVKNEKKNSKASCLYAILDKIDGFLNMAYFFNLFKAMQLEAVIGAMTSILSIDPWSLSGIVNVVFSVVVMLFYLVLILLVLYLVSMNLDWKESEKRRNKDKDAAAGFQVSLTKDLELLKELKQQSKHRKSLRAIVALSILQDFFIPLALIIFIEMPLAQIITAILFMSICVYTVIRYTPFQETPTNFLEAGNRAIYILILLVFLVNHRLDESISEKARFNYIGFGVIGLVALLIGFNIGISVWVIGIQVKKMCSKKKKTKQQDQGKMTKKEKLEPFEKEEKWISIEKKQAKRVGVDAKSKKSHLNRGFEFLENDQKVEKESYQLQNKGDEFKFDNIFGFGKTGKGQERQDKKFQPEFHQAQIQMRKKNNRKNKQRIISFDKQKGIIASNLGQNQFMINSSKLERKIEKNKEKEDDLGLDLDEFMLE